MQLGHSILDLRNKLQRTTFPGVFSLVARNKQMKKYPWVSEDAFVISSLNGWNFMSSQIRTINNRTHPSTLFTHALYRRDAKDPTQSFK